jgi:hypothetical protein
MHARQQISSACLIGLLAVTAPAAAGERLHVRATLAELPKSPACTTRPVRVLCRYRLERWLDPPPGQQTASTERPRSPLRGEAIWVMQRCPELPRGTSKFGQGSAPRLRVGQVHLLELEQWLGDVDVAPEGASRKMYQAVNTDTAPPRPRMAVVVTGPSGAKVKLEFDDELVTVGRAADSDVLLNHPAISLHHLVLEANTDQVVVTDLQPGRARLGGKQLQGSRRLTSRDTLSVGPFSLNVVLFMPRETNED